MFLELRQHPAYGDTRRTRGLAELAECCGDGLATANTPYYLNAEGHRILDRVAGMLRRGMRLPDHPQPLQPSFHPFNRHSAILLTVIPSP